MKYLKNSNTIKKSIFFIIIIMSAFLVSQLISLLVIKFSGVDISDIYNIKDYRSIYAIKFIQLINSVFIFILGPLIFSIYIKYNYKKIFRINNKTIFISIILLLLFLLASTPIISFSEIIWKNLLSLDLFKPIAILAKQQESNNLAIIKILLTQNSVIDIVLNIIIIALIPAIGEEIFFRGVLQNLFASKFSPHLAIIITSIIFSVTHMETTGILPRLLLSLYLGYLFYWSSSLIYPIVAHFLNNLMAILAYYVIGVLPSTANSDTYMNNWPWYLITLSILTTMLIIIAIKKNLNKSL